ncbi:MAG: spermidine synthase, partial [Myxococcota bacterium]
YAIFFLSGGAALLFETLWFHQAGLAFGNSVWASSIVLASFMIGLALGNALAARWTPRLRHPLRVYGLLELLIGLTGWLLVWQLPAWGGALAPLLAPWIDQPWLVNPVRLAGGFLLLLVPATAMGATLPLLVGVLMARDPHFGSVLGRLYGWNTLGAMLGAVVGELLLIAWLGIRGAGVFAVACNVLAALGAFGLSRDWPGVRVAPARPASRLSKTAVRVVLAAALSGAVLLAYEVVWFRFLELFIAATSTAFAVMLATVLAGIGSGGVMAGFWLRRRPADARLAPVVALLAGALAVAGYAGFRFVLDRLAAGVALHPAEVLELTVALSLPVSIASGVLFTLLGSQLATHVSPESRATGILTCANTVGAGVGSLCAGFVLLPELGIEASFVLLAALYGVVAFLGGSGGGEAERVPWRAVAPAGALFALALLLFPFGMLRDHYLQRAIDQVARRGNWSVEAIREGVTETAILLRKGIGGEPLFYRLMTNSFSMSGTSWASRRYMGLYTWWPVALSPEPKDALLISYGIGNTARSLTDVESLEQIDVVDTSRQILELSEVLYAGPQENPLDDPRVRVHVEDGRYFLQTTPERFDLITGEPPPPKYAGVVNLYTQEYFELVRSRLEPGGINTYWLPAHDIREQDARTIIRAYCRAFPDCSLWSGSGLDWMLVGSRDAEGQPSASAFALQWEDPVVGAQLRELGIEVPEQLGALFIADAEQLDAWVGDTPPLADDRPGRLASGSVTDPVSKQVFRSWMDTDAARQRFFESAFIRR